jgi:hypothetical protein
VICEVLVGYGLHLYIEDTLRCTRFLPVNRTVVYAISYSQDISQADTIRKRPRRFGLTSVGEFVS